MNMEEFIVNGEQFKSELSRSITLLRRLLVEQDVSGVQNCLSRLKNLFDKLESCHYAHIDRLEDEDVIKSADARFNEALNVYIDNVNKAKKWLKNVAADTLLCVPSATSLENISVVSQTSVSSEIASALSLPKIEISKFSGEPKHYQSFLTVFDEVIASKVADDRSKLTHLLNHLSGEAFTAVQTCTIMNASAGYARAREILKERYGNSYVVSQSLLHELRHGVRITKPQELRQLSDTLVMAQHTLQSLGMTQEVDNQNFLRDVVNRCPTWVKDSWSGLALSRKESRGTYPMFEDLCEFIHKKAEAACDPIYGRLREVNVKSNHVQAESKSSDRATHDNAPECCACGGKHSVVECRNFQRMDTSQRFQLAKENRLCFVCLKGRHAARFCRTDILCSVADCGGKHHELLHFDRRRAMRPQRQEYSPRRPGASNTTQSDGGRVQSHACHATRSRQVYLPVVPALIQGKVAYCLLDTGSSCTLITKRFANELGIEGTQVCCNVDTVNSSASWNTEAVEVELKSMDGEQVTRLRNVLVVTDIPAEVPCRTIDLSIYEHLKDLPIEFASTGTCVDVLIGMDHPELLVPLDVRRDVSKSGMPYACLTTLGWALQGPVSDNDRTRVNNVNLKDISERVDILWKIESGDEDLVSDSIEDRKVESRWDDNVRQVDGHYELPVPLKSGTPDMHNNRAYAAHRLEGTVKKLHKLGQYAEHHEGMTKMVKDGYAEEVPRDQLKGEFGKVWYLPHHGVYHPAKRKLRIVFDCAAKYRQVSLNNQCFQGPDLVNKLTHVLLRFRLFEVAVVADVKAMYMQVKVPSKDRDCLRYMWYDGKKVQEYRMTSHLFGGVWCASSSTYALRRVLKDYECSEIVKSAIEHATYVDDLLKSVPHVHEAQEVAVGSRELLKKGEFDIVKFLSNKEEVLKDLPEDARAYGDKVISSNTQDKALGIQWNVKGDYFLYNSFEESNKGVTKRELLSRVSSMFDPLGLVSPITVSGRLIFQEATRSKLGWDENLPSDISLRWSSWTSSLKDLSSLIFPRCVIPTSLIEGAFELHHFSDASEVAYGACSYLRVLGPDGTIRVSLLMSKSRVAPIKPMTIPRLELSAAGLSVRLDAMLRRELHIDLLPSYFWSDSKIVLAYIANESRRFKVFVGNRVSYIRENTEVAQWHYVPTDCNPADIVSRGSSPALLPDMWNNGPQFLSDHKCDWPQWDASLQVGEIDPEVRKQLNHVVHDGTSRGRVDFFETLANHYGSFYKMKKAVAWWSRFVKWLTNKRERVVPCPVTMSELKVAESLIISHIQREAYVTEISDLTSKGAVKKSSSIVSLNPKLVEGLLLVGGRLKHSLLDASAKYPLILPPKHRITKLVLADFHNKAHLGVEWTASLVRQQFWVPSLRRHLRCIRRECMKCKMWYDSPMRQKMADLPEDRCVKSDKPFDSVGVDLFGPFLVKQGRSSVKRYGCIFSCLSSRAIHIEVLHSLETDSFINGLSRFCARRGHPSIIRSDCGTNFVGCQAELRREFRRLDKAALVRGARRKDIDWRFNPPRASHFGGAWERMIRTVRRVFMAVLNPHCTMTDEVLSTALCEVEGIVNGRPLTKLSQDVDDSSPLTPNHILMLCGNSAWPWSDVSPGDAYRRKWKAVQSIANMFWDRWIKEYIPSLQRRQVCVEERDDINVGDLVLVTDETCPRGLWPLGLITKTHGSRDGLVRSVTVRTCTATLDRPITKLVHLELANQSS